MTLIISSQWMSVPWEEAFCNGGTHSRTMITMCSFWSVCEIKWAELQRFGSSKMHVVSVWTITNSTFISFVVILGFCIFNRKCKKMKSLVSWVPISKIGFLQITWNVWMLGFEYKQFCALFVYLYLANKIFAQGYAVWLYKNSMDFYLIFVMLFMCTWLSFAIFVMYCCVW